MAKAGKTAEEIVMHYFQGVSIDRAGEYANGISNQPKQIARKKADAPCAPCNGLSLSRIAGGCLCE